MNLSTTVIARNPRESGGTKQSITRIGKTSFCMVVQEMDRHVGPSGLLAMTRGEEGVLNT